MDTIYIVGEDILHDVIGKKLLRDYCPTIRNYLSYIKRGNSPIKEKIQGYNEMAKFVPFLVFTDLDRFPCPINLIKHWINFEKNTNLLFRIAVKEAEAWLLADIENFAKFLGISKSLIPNEVENLESPKEFLIDLVRRKSRKRDVKDAILPISISKIGPGYNMYLSDFVMERWNPEIARSRSRSLDKTINALQSIV